MPDSPKEKDRRNFGRFDFPPGAGPDEIAAAVCAAHDRVMAEKTEQDRQEKEANTQRKT